MLRTKICAREKDEEAKGMVSINFGKKPQIQKEPPWEK